MKKYYTDEKNVQIILAVLKANNISKVIASPGATNVTLVASMQCDQFFEIYSAVDERSAAYMACGMAHETGAPVVLSCTGATASRNYLPGLTEAYYRKLPVIAITSTQLQSKVGHHIPQIIDRSVKPVDTHRISVDLPFVKDNDEFWECEVKVNQAILELERGGGGPVHINLPTCYSRNFDTKVLPSCRIMKRFTEADTLPALKRKVAVFVGSHRDFTQSETEALDRFCSLYDAVVFCDHTSGFKGKYRVLFSLASSQDQMELSGLKPDISIHIGEISGDYSGTTMIGKEVWRVNVDGEIRDTFGKLSYVFEMDPETFCERYAAASANAAPSDEYLRKCQLKLEDIRRELPVVPLSNIWIAYNIAHRIPDNSVIHFGILNSLRSWNFFELPKSVRSISNVGGFGIDGGISSLLGASLSDNTKLYFGVIGDLAFFYDMNSLGNRHAGNNLRLLVVNNGKGTEFRQYNHSAAHFDTEADNYIAASGHFGNKSHTLIKHYAQNLGFEYISASTKDEFVATYEIFLEPSIGDRPIVFEVFTNSDDESRALQMVRNIKKDIRKGTKLVATRLLGQNSTKAIKRMLRKT